MVTGHIYTIQFPAEAIVAPAGGVVLGPHPPAEAQSPDGLPEASYSIKYLEAPSHAPLTFPTFPYLSTDSRAWPRPPSVSALKSNYKSSSKEALFGDTKIKDRKGSRWGGLTRWSGLEIRNIRQ